MLKTLSGAAGAGVVVGLGVVYLVLRRLLTEGVEDPILGDVDWSSEVL